MNVWLIVGLTLVALAVVAVLVWRRREPGAVAGPDGESPWLLIQNQLNELTRTNSELRSALESKLTESSRALHQSVTNQMGESNKIIRDVTERLTKLDETNRQVVGFADQLRSLEDILKNPKQRGILGEYYLETLLKNVLPGSYQMQYAFKNGEIVDAAVFVREKIIPIDSKFSLENYNRLVVEKDPAEKERLEKQFVSDLKLRIQETAKYIRPEEGTMDFAFMFIPHEAIYYDLLVNKIGAVAEDTESLIERAANKYRVIIVSPTSFLAYLQTVMQGLKALQIEEQAKDIIQRVGELGRHLKSYEDYYGRLGNALGTVVSHYNAGGKELKKIDKDVYRITGSAPGLEPLALDKPSLEE